MGYIPRHQCNSADFKPQQAREHTIFAAPLIVATVSKLAGQDKRFPALQCIRLRRLAVKLTGDTVRLCIPIHHAHMQHASFQWSYTPFNLHHNFAKCKANRSVRSICLAATITCFGKKKSSWDAAFTDVFQAACAAPRESNAHVDAPESDWVLRINFEFRVQVCLQFAKRIHCRFRKSRTFVSSLALGASVTHCKLVSVKKYYNGSTDQTLIYFNCNSDCHRLYRFTGETVHNKSCTHTAHAMWSCCYTGEPFEVKIRAGSTWAAGSIL